MATGLKSPAPRGNHFLALPLLCAIAGGSYAEALNDPTRPPAEISTPAASGVQAAVAEVNRLQSIIISSTRRAAIINGQTVELGEKLGDVRLVEVSASGVVLEGAQGRQVLALFPGVDLKQNTGGEQKQKIEPPAEQAKSVKRTKKKSLPSNEAAGQAASKERK